jgi:group I intron endonuclease
MPTGKIYKISNNFNDKEYVGQTWSELHERFKGHCSPGSKCIKLRNAIQAHGKENFIIELLWEGECTQEQLDEYEVELIGLFDTLDPYGYNLKEGGYGGKHSLESRQKMSEALTNPSPATRMKRSIALTGRIVSEQTRQRMSDSHKGKINSEETRQKLSIALKGRILTPEHRLKLSESLKGKKLSQFNRERLIELTRNRIVTAETRQKMSAARKGRTFTEEHKARLRESRRNRVTKHVVSLETRAKQSAALKGRVFTEEHRAKLHEAAQRRKNAIKDTEHILENAI